MNNTITPTFRELKDFEKGILGYLAGFLFQWLTVLTYIAVLGANIYFYGWVSLSLIFGIAIYGRKRFVEEVDHEEKSFYSYLYIGACQYFLDLDEVMKNHRLPAERKWKVLARLIFLQYFILWNALTNKYLKQ